MVRKGNLAVFESSTISETRELTPTKIGVRGRPVKRGGKARHYLVACVIMYTIALPTILPCPIFDVHSAEPRVVSITSL